MSLSSLIQAQKECNLKMRIALWGAVACAITACSPSPEQLKKTLQEHPDILHAAIEADPKGFFDIVQKVQAKAREQAEAAQMDQDLKQVAVDLKNPKTVEIAKSRAAKGPDSAPVTIVEWSDFNCGHCAHAEETLEKIKQDYGDKVRVVFKHLPILAKESRTAAEYMEAIAIENPGAALKFHDQLFSRQGEFRQGGEEFLKKLTKEIGANLAKVEKARKSSAVRKLIETDIDEAKKFDFTGTPGFMVNGAPVRGAYPYDFFKKVIDSILAGGGNGPAAPSAPAVAPAKTEDKKPEGA